MPFCVVATWLLFELGPNLLSVLLTVLDAGWDR